MHGCTLLKVEYPIVPPSPDRVNVSLRFATSILLCAKAIYQDCSRHLGESSLDSLIPKAVHNGLGYGITPGDNSYSSGEHTLINSEATASDVPSEGLHQEFPRQRYSAYDKPESLIFGSNSLKNHFHLLIPENQLLRKESHAEILSHHDPELLRRVEWLQKLHETDGSSGTVKFQEALEAVTPFWSAIAEIRQKSQKLKSMCQWARFGELRVSHCKVQNAPENKKAKGLLWLIQEDGGAYTNLLALDKIVALWLMRTLKYHEGCLLETNQANHPNIETAKRNFHQWLFNEFFFPRQGLPVMGFTWREVLGRHSAAKNFGWVQRTIIEYLTQASEEVNENLTLGFLVFSWLQADETQSIKNLYNYQRLAEIKANIKSKPKRTKTKKSEDWL
ncbi:hypothetical protein O181_023881 [Austropuccinia psidii MF-1]|uniref:Uncharacterized protein n=1 Tax=Austropuccinia psidii MF-1 TaxID=1389203 RepID=A0A9Q3GY29_9BASI|nr:hypothetical protein [Austropuccinia psidii MF-1]